MTKNKTYTFFSIIIGVFYISLLYLDCFSNRNIETYQLKYGIMWLLFLETTFSLSSKGDLWNNWLWKLRLAVIVADYFFLFTPYNGAGIGGYLVVQMIYQEKLREQIQNGEIRRHWFLYEFAMILILTGIGIIGDIFSVYIFGIIYAFVIFRNLKMVWKHYLEGRKELEYLALSLSFLALCDTSIFFYFLWSGEIIGNLIWSFYIPSQLLLAKYE